MSREVVKKEYRSVFVLFLCAALLLTAFLTGQRLLKSLQRSSGQKETGAMQVLVFGDSIWDLSRDESGIAAQLQSRLGEGSVVYNGAIKGSRCSMVADSAREQENQICFYTRAREYAEGKILQEAAFDEVDCIVIAYGLNDYFGAAYRTNPADYFDPYTYTGAMCSGIAVLKECCPDAQIVIVSPTYCQGYAYGQVIHESTTHDYGAGTGENYAASAKAVAESFGACFVDMFHDLDISVHNGAAYLEDATHLTALGREKYAEHLADAMLPGVE